MKNISSKAKMLDVKPLIAHYMDQGDLGVKSLILTIYQSYPQALMNH